VDAAGSPLHPLPVRLLTVRLLAMAWALTWWIFPGFGLIDLSVTWDPGWPVVLEASWGLFMTVLVAGSFLTVAVRPHARAAPAVILAVTLVAWAVSAVAALEWELLGFAGLLAAEAVLVALLLDVGAHRREALDVDVDRPPADRAAARRRRDRPADPGQQRPDDQEGGPHRLAERVRHLVGGQVAGADADPVLGLVEVDLGAELAQDGQHLAHVVDDRQVVDDALFARQERGGQNRQCGVLRARHVYVAMEGDAAGDDETISVHWPRPS
jgi:hypothetical protein